MGCVFELVWCPPNPGKMIHLSLSLSLSVSVSLSLSLLFGGSLNLRSDLVYRSWIVWGGFAGVVSNTALCTALCKGPAQQMRLSAATPRPTHQHHPGVALNCISLTSSG